MRPFLAGDPAWVGRYRLLGRLGAGGMGTVFLAVSPGGRLVALKVVRSDFAADEGFRERFRREIAAARRVGGAGTAPVLDGDADAPRPWFAAAYVPGPTLAEAVGAVGPFPEGALRALGAGLAEALLDVHAAGLVHRDLKPGNILLAEDGPKIIDFGVTKAVDASQLTATGAMVGTPAFMSPEQIAESRDAGPASDVFSLAGALVYAATGAGPFSAGDPASLIYRVMYEEPRLDGVPGPLRGVLSACLAKEPDRRPVLPALLEAFLPADPAALLSPALRREVAAREAEAAALAGGAVTPPPPPPRIDGEDARGPGRRRVLGLAAAAAVGALGAGGGATAWALTRGGGKPAKPVPRPARLVAAPDAAWTLSWPGKFEDGLPLDVSPAGGTIVWRGLKGICGIDAASGRWLWMFDRPVGSTTTRGYGVFGDRVFGLAHRSSPRPNSLYVIDPVTGASSTIELPGDVTRLAEVYGRVGGTVFVGAATRGTGDQTVVLAVDVASGRVLWRRPSGARKIYGAADGGALYVVTPAKVLGIDAGTGARRWERTWFTGRADRSTAYPATLGDGYLFFTATGASTFYAVGTRDGTIVWTKRADDMQRPVLPVGPDVIAAGEKGFYAYDQATGALRRRQTSSPAGLDWIGGSASAAGSAELVAASFTGHADSSGTSGDSGFFVAGTGGGPVWAHRGPAYNNGGWGLAVAGRAVYATDNRRLRCFRPSA
ncbi:MULTISPECIES: protein kinase domain-containing protein [Actinomadura]|uniref:PQQ-binding-like beta-propeller repeat protein n=1 Tax=Actinomadura yumaensis TaxID=111807 RepID=A0ABW2CEQ3_9ACTN|nr:PQQ-binding-like beta-propeller repeat protein [Actinomadura sp. J1-007]